MKKIRILALLLCMPALLSLTLLCSFAGDGDELLIDRADLLSDDEAQVLEKRLLEASEELDFDFVILTVRGTGGKDILQYADDYKDMSSYRQDAAILVVDMYTREWCVATYGFGNKAISEDATYRYLEDRFVPSLSSGDYAHSFNAYLSGAEKLVGDAREGHYYVYIPWGRNLLIALVVGGIVGLLVVTSMKSKLKSVAMKSSAAGYVKEGSFDLTRSRDIFLYRTHTRVYSPRQKSSGGGSGGGSRGGGRGRF